MRCRICDSLAVKTFSTRILGRYEAGYYRCSSCGFMQTDEPYWLGEAYATAITAVDLGPINRAMANSKQVAGIVLSAFDSNAKFVDYGAGYGVLVRLMRDAGFDFYWHDRYCDNVFAKHFVAQPGTRYELLTAFEVFEHLVDPLPEIEQMLTYSDSLMFSTLLVPKKAASESEWWYFGPEHGQHVAFYTVPALRVIARKFGLNLATDGNETHLLSKHSVSERTFRFFAKNTRWSRMARSLIRHRLRKRSLLSEDFLAVSGHRI